MSRTTSIALALAIGLAIGLLMVAHAGIGKDQALMLDLGRAMLAEGRWLDFGMPTSAGGRSPGGMTGLLVAAPLWIWNDPRSPALFTLALHALAFGLLLRVAKPALGEAGLAVLVALAWLSPWQLFFGSHLWNANYMYVFAVLHLVSLTRLARNPGRLDSAVHVFLFGIALQVHTSAFVLAIGTALLVWRGAVRLDRVGLLLGGLALLLPYGSWLLAVNGHDDLLPGERGFPFRSLLLVHPWLRGAIQILRMGSLGVAERMLDLDFVPRLGAGVNAWLRPVALAIVGAAQVTLLGALWTCRRLLTNAWRRRRGPVARPGSPQGLRAWLRTYAVAIILAMLVAFAAAPTAAMFWQALVLIPAAALAMALQADALARTRLAGVLRPASRALGLLAATMSLLMAFGAPIYR
jgi:hypothetical protein